MLWQYSLTGVLNAGIKKLLFSTSISLDHMLSTVRPLGVIDTVVPDRGKLVTLTTGSSKRRWLLIVVDGQQSVVTRSLYVMSKTTEQNVVVHIGNLGGAVGSVAVRAAWLRWSATLGSRPRLAESLCQVIVAYTLRLNSRAGTEGSTMSSLICDRWLILGSETLSISRCLNHW